MAWQSGNDAVNQVKGDIVKPVTSFFNFGNKPQGKQPRVGTLGYEFGQENRKHQMRAENAQSQAQALRQKGDVAGAQRLEQQAQGYRQQAEDYAHVANNPALRHQKGDGYVANDRPTPEEAARQQSSGDRSIPPKPVGAPEIPSTEPPQLLSKPVRPTTSSNPETPGAVTPAKPVSSNTTEPPVTATPQPTQATPPVRRPTSSTTSEQPKPTRTDSPERQPAKPTNANEELLPASTAPTKPNGQVRLRGELRYSQADVSPTMDNGTGKKVPIDEVSAGMRRDGFPSGAAPVVVEYPDGTRVSVDHRRLVAADKAGLEQVPAKITPSNTRLPEKEIKDRRFPLRTTEPITDPRTGKVYKPGDVAGTYGEAALFRSADRSGNGAC
jgi:hypothetical protein